MFYDDIITAVNFGVVDIEAGEELRPMLLQQKEFAAHTLNFCLGFQLMKLQDIHSLTVHPVNIR